MRIFIVHTLGTKQTQYDSTDCFRFVPINMPPLCVLCLMSHPLCCLSFRISYNRLPNIFCSAKRRALASAPSRMDCGNIKYESNQKSPESAQIQRIFLLPTHLIWKQGGWKLTIKGDKAGPWMGVWHFSTAEFTLSAFLRFSSGSERLRLGTFKKQWMQGEPCPPLFLGCDRHGSTQPPQPPPQAVAWAVAVARRQGLRSGFLYPSIVV